MFFDIEKSVFLQPRKTNGTELWCNGSTTDFGSACVGSNPASSTENELSPTGGSFFIRITGYFAIYQQIIKKKTQFQSYETNGRTCKLN